MFQFGTDDDDERQDGLAAALIGARPNGMPDFGLGATLVQVPDSSNGIPATSDTVNGIGGDVADAAGSGTPDADMPEATPADDSGAGNWGETLAKLYEAGKFKSGYLSKIFGATDYANLAAGTASTSIAVGLSDIQTYEEIGSHQPQQQGSVIHWELVDWSKYGADQGLPPKTVMQRFFAAAMTN